MFYPRDSIGKLLQIAFGIEILDGSYRTYSWSDNYHYKTLSQLQSSAGVEAEQQHSVSCAQAKQQVCCLSLTSCTWHQSYKFQSPPLTYPLLIAMESIAMIRRIKRSREDAKKRSEEFSQSANNVALSCYQVVVAERRSTSGQWYFYMALLPGDQGFALLIVDCYFLVGAKDYGCVPWTSSCLLCPCCTQSLALALSTSLDMSDDWSRCPFLVFESS